MGNMGGQAYHYAYIVWEKARVIAGCNSEEFRKDVMGAIIRRSDLNHVDSVYGWCMDLEQPVWDSWELTPGKLVPISCLNKMRMLDRLKLK